MKKLLGILALTAVAASAFAQGTVVIGNQTGTVKQWTDTGNSTLISAIKTGGVQVELIAASTSAAAPAALFTPTTGGVSPKYTTLAAFLAASPGWAVATGTANPGGLSVNGIFANGNATIANIADSANAQYFIIGWNGGFGSVDQAIAAGAFGGMSAVYTTATASPVGTPSPPTPINLRSTFGGVTLAPIIVPEPASFALAGLGLAALLAFRRRS